MNRKNVPLSSLMKAALAFWSRQLGGNDSVKTFGGGDDFVVAVLGGEMIQLA